MSYLSKANISIVVYGEKFPVEDFFNTIGLVPTDTGKCGEKRKNGATLKETFWKYQLSDTDALEGLEESINELINLFAGKEERIKQFTLLYNLKLKVFIVIRVMNKEDVGVLLSDKVIKFLNELNASIEIDTYNI